MRTLDLAVIGSGIGGSLISAYQKEKNLVVFEKEKNLGGCASTFQRFGYFYNTGATTFVGYEEGDIIKKIFDKIEIKPNLIQTKVAIRVVQNDQVLDRIQDFDQFLENIQKRFPHKNNYLFWKKIKNIDEKFWKLQNIYFGKYSFQRYWKTTLFLKELLQLFGIDIFKSATQFIKESLGEISQEYQDFIDAQLLITVQTNSSHISLLSLALGLAYPFHEVFYPNGGMGSLIEEILKDIEVKKNEEILSITQKKNGWYLQSSKEQYFAKKIVLNTTVYESGKLFPQTPIKNYFERFPFSDQSAFVVYLTLDTKENFLEHYQFIFEKVLPNSISNSFFISFSNPQDTKLSKNGTLSVTISTHTKASFWKNLSQEQYEEKKGETQRYIVEKFLEYFDMIDSTDILKSFSATSKTFHRYINRYNCGGKAIGLKTIFELPTNATPFEGLYSVGDTVFAGQGWPGIALGVEVLNKELCDG